MKKNKRRVLAYVLAITLVLGNFAGFDMTAKAADGIPEITDVSVAVDSVPATGGDVEVTVTGTDLPDKLYYRIQKKVPGENFYTTIEKDIEIPGPGAQGGAIKVPIKANEGTEARTIRVGINYLKVSSGYKYAEDMTQNAVGGETPSVDKIALKAAIEKAKKLVQSEYTEASWEVMQEALKKAEKVNNDTQATETAVKEATENLENAIKALQPAEKPQDRTSIKARVMDEENKPVSDVEFILTDMDMGETIEIDPSDSKGEVEKSVASLYDGTYNLKIATTSEYTFEPADGYTYTVAGGKITKVDGQDYTEDVQAFTAKKQGGQVDPDPDEPEANTEAIKIKVVDEKGKPVSDTNCKFAIVDTAYPANESVKKYPKDGEFTVDKFEKSQEGAIIRLQKDSVYTATPEKYELTLDKGVIKTVDGKAYDGRTEYTFTVKGQGGTEEDKPFIESATIVPEEFDEQGGTASLLVKGDKLNDKMSVVVKTGGQATDIQPEKDALSTDKMHSYQIRFPKNDTTQTKYYSVQCIVGESALDNKYLMVTVAGKEEGGNGENPEGEVKITELTSDVEGDISKDGATVNLSVTGENLGSSNWSAEATGYLEGTTFEKGSVKATNVTATGAQLEIPKTTVASNRIEWHVIAGPVNEAGEVQKQQELILYQEKKLKTVRVDIKKAELVDEHTLEVSFAENIKIADEMISDEDALKKLFSIDGKVIFNEQGNPSGTETYYLQKDDKISVDGSKLTITFKDGITLNNGRFTFKEGGLVTAESGEYLTKLTHSILSGATVTGVKFDKDVFDYKGGQVIARLQGMQLDSLETEQITAKVTNPTTRKEFEVGLEIVTGEEPVVTFNVPENRTTSTQSYLLNLNINEKPIYGGTGIRGERLIVSVLPKGTDAGSQTLSSMTISGNNEMDQDQTDQTKVTVYAVPGDEGSLKTEIRLAGTNLISAKTEVRAIDENGVIWPISHVPE